MTKYDCSSADINPIGGICKADLRRMIEHAANAYRGMGVLGEIANAAPTAELQPLEGADGGAGGEGGEAGGYAQLDEEDMGMTYAELTVFGRLRKIYRCGPVSMFRALLANGALSAAQGAARVVALSAREIAVKVKRFFFFYAINRHKMTTLTPSYHAESYSPDDNRFDFRPFLYNAAWSRQSKNIDAMVEEEERRESVI
jgi:NAD+ synthase (glutamine-hydrolysing)